MSLNKIIIIFGVVLVLFASAVFYQFSKKQTAHLPMTDVIINDKTFHSEVAKSQKDQERGLSGRTSLPQDNGMLFIFSKPGYYPFWMREMNFPLDIVFIENNKIVAIYQNLPPMKKNANGPIYGAEIQADRVLEINAGLAKKYFFNKGDSVKINL